MTRLLLAVALTAFCLAPALAADAHLDIIHEQCGIQLNLSSGACDCLRSSAAGELNENQQAFMAARVTMNQPEIDRTQPLLSQKEAIQVGTFMTSIVDRCGG
jgi:hypothetical protein